MEAMKQPTPLWQVISICITVLIASFTGIISQSNKTAGLAKDMENLKIEMFNIKMNSDKKFDKMDNKIDLIQNDTRQILINMERKADRK